MTIPVGSSSASVVVSPIDDGVVEGDESVDVTLVAGVGYELGAVVAGSVTIADDDVALPVVSLGVVDGAARAGSDPCSVCFVSHGRGAHCN